MGQNLISSIIAITLLSILLSISFQSQISKKDSIEIEETLHRYIRGSETMNNVVFNTGNLQWYKQNNPREQYSTSLDTIITIIPAPWSTILLDSITFKWTSSTASDSFKLQISQASNFSDIIEEVILSDTVYVPMNLVPGKTYFWRVRILDNGMIGDWTSPSRFRIKGIDLTDRLMAYYPFSGNAEDSLGLSDGIPNGNAALSTDRLNEENQAYSFGGEGDYIQLPENETFKSIEKEISLSAWIKPGAPSFEESIIHRDRFWRFFLYSDGTVVGNIFNENNEEMRIGSQLKVQKNEWSMVTITYGRDSIKVYVNGVKSAELEYSIDRIGNPVISSIPYIGKGFGNSFNDFAGSIDEVRIYDRFLNEEEVQELYDLTNPSKENIEGTFIELGNEILVRTSKYCIGFNKSDGSISQLSDTESEQIISAGTADRSLWKARFSRQGLLGSKLLVDLDLLDFTYSWNENNNKLVFNYTPYPNSVVPLSVDVEFTFQDSSFSSNYSVSHQMDDTINYFQLFNDVSLIQEDINEAITTWWPGIKFNKSFFEEGRTMFITYPTSFSDFVHLGIGNSSLTVYSVVTDDITPKMDKLLYRNNDSGAYSFNYSQQVHIEKNTNWKSPKLKMLFDVPIRAATDQYRMDIGLENFTEIKEKLGSKYEAISQSLNVKWDVPITNFTFGFNLTNRQKYEHLWQSLPGKSLLFITSFPTGFQDESNPDIFPIDPSLGTDEDFKEICLLAQEYGHSIMPYINPTFWDDQSPSSLSMDPEEYVQINADGSLKYECYDGRCGYSVSPYSPFVIQRLEEQMKELSEKLPLDFVWEDQVGSRGEMDFNKYMPNPAHHAQGWLDHARKYKSMNLLCEHGYDRQVESHVGYQGNLLLYINADIYGEKGWGNGNWNWYPIVPMMAKDKILFYMAPDHPIDSKERLSWTLAYGQMPSLFLLPDSYNSVWHKTAQVFQEQIFGPFLHERLTHFEYLPNNLSRTKYETIDITTNWSEDQPYSVDSHIVAPQGMYVQNDDETLIAGLFTTYNGFSLENDEHYIIERQYADSIVIWHPKGIDSEIKIKRRILVDEQTYLAYARSKSEVFEIPLSWDENFFTLSLERMIDSKEITNYILTHSAYAKLTTPIILNPDHWQTVSSEGVRIDWKNSEATDSFEINISSDQRFDNMVIQEFVSDSSFIPELLEAGNTYFARVRAVKHSERSAWSSTIRFRVDGLNLEDRLMAYYPFNRSPEDLFNRSNGAIFGQVASVQDRFMKDKKAMYFDGEEDFIQLPENEIMTKIDRQISLSAWVNPESLGNEKGIIQRDRFWRLFLNADGAVYGNIFDEKNGEMRIWSQDRISTGEWSMVTVTYDQQYIRIYINGALSNELFYPVERIGHPLVNGVPYIGKGFANSFNDFHGAIDDVRIYDRFLTDQEVKALYDYSIIQKTATVTVHAGDRYTAENMSGILHGVFTKWDDYSSVPPHDSLIELLSPTLWRIGTADNTMYSYIEDRSDADIILAISDVYGYEVDGVDPPYLDSAAFVLHLNEIIEESKNRNYIYDLWNEPDIDFFWSGTKDQFFWTSKIMHDQIRSNLGDDVLISAPSIAYPDSNYLREFFNFALSKDLQIDVLSFHWLGPNLRDLKDFIIWCRKEFIKNDRYAPVGVKEIQVNEIVGPAYQYKPGAHLAHFQYLEEGGADGACKACWDSEDGTNTFNCWNNTLDGLLTTNTLEPRSAWWLYRKYAELGSHRYQVSIDDLHLAAIAGMGPDSTFRILVGHYAQENDLEEEDIEIHLDGIPEFLIEGSDSLFLHQYLIPNSEFNPLFAPEWISTETVNSEDRIFSTQVPTNGVVVLEWEKKENFSTTTFENAPEYNFQIYPNPTKDWINVVGNQLSQYRVALYTANGQLLDQYRSINDHLIINTADYPDGIFFLKFYNHQRELIYYHKIIKIK